MISPVKIIKTRFFMLYRLLFFVSFMPLYMHAEVTPFKGEFLFKGPVLTLTTVREMNIDNNLGSFTFSGKNAIGNLKISSTFSINNDEFESLDYEFRARAAFIINRKQKLVFDENITSSGDHDWVIAQDSVSNKILDPLTAQLALASKIAQGKEEVTLFLPNLKNGEIESNDFMLVQAESLVIDGIEYECAVVERIRENDNRITKYWFAKSLDYLLIKTVDVDDNGTVEMTMTKLLSFG
jgi:hypothetical protein